MECADEALLPAVYRETACYPLDAYGLRGYAAVRYDRSRVVAVGAFLWAASTFLVAVSGSFAQVAVARGTNGIGLAFVTPAIQSLVADYTDDNKRGSAFGWLQLTGNLGSLIGSLFLIMLASTTFMGIAGWRIAFHVVALISIVVGILVRLFAVDPHFQNVEICKQLFRKPAWSEMKDLAIEAKAVIKIPSFQIILWLRASRGRFHGLPCHLLQCGWS